MYIHTYRSARKKENEICFGILASFCTHFRRQNKSGRLSQNSNSNNINNNNYNYNKDPAYHSPPDVDIVYVGAVALRAPVSKFWLD